MRAFALLLVFSGTVALAAQEPKPDKKDGKPEPAKKVPAKKEPVPGRKLMVIEGFTFYPSDEAATEVAQFKAERSPLEALAYECKLLERILSPKAVDLLRRLTVFVDWDNRPPLTNGRTGAALAFYYGGSPQQMVKEGRHPLQSRGVTINSLKVLTQQRQPKDDNRVACLLLHEFAHAVHDQLFTYDHAGIRAMYEQAMERRLYDKEFYAATNHIEFFAEMTCAFFDRLHHYPHDRDDLKKHDPVTYKTLETVWAGAVPRKKVELLPVAHSAPADLNLALATDVRLGTAVLGDLPPPDALAGKVVVIGFWGGDFTNVLDRLNRIQNELGDYGLVALGVHAYAGEPDEVRAKAERRGAAVPVLVRTFVRADAKLFRSEPGGRALVFGTDGKCVYRSSAYDAETAARAAVGKRLLADALGPGDPPEAFKGVVAAFAGGATPVGAYAKVSALASSSDPDVKAKATKLADAILAPGTTALAGAQAGAKADPVNSFFVAERVAERFKGTPLATKATALVTKLRVEKPVSTELKARTLAAQLEQLAGKLRGAEGSVEPTGSTFQTKNRAALEQLKAQVEQLKKQYPTARATADALRAAGEFGVK